MTQPTIEITSAPKSDDVEFIDRQIIQFNGEQIGQTDYKPLAVFFRDADNQIVGGLTGATYRQWLHVDVLWLHAAFRGQGYGDMLLATAEQEAIKRGCLHVYLDSFSFQAPKFYQKRGYTIFGELPNFPQGHTRYFLTKALR